jgi:hypothetical protein
MKYWREPFQEQMKRLLVERDELLEVQAQLLARAHSSSSTSPTATSRRKRKKPATDGTVKLRLEAKWVRKTRDASAVLLVRTPLNLPGLPTFTLRSVTPPGQRTVHLKPLVAALKRYVTAVVEDPSSPWCKHKWTFELRPDTTSKDFTQLNQDFGHAQPKKAAVARGKKRFKKGLLLVQTQTGEWVDACGKFAPKSATPERAADPTRPQPPDFEPLQRWPSC